MYYVCVCVYVFMYIFIIVCVCIYLFIYYFPAGDLCTVKYHAFLWKSVFFFINPTIISVPDSAGSICTTAYADQWSLW